MMKLKIYFGIAFLFFTALNGNAQISATDGNWQLQYQRLENTSEADLMIRYGDIDNLGFGWGNTNPFDGKATPLHGFPWTRNPIDSLGLDMIMTTSNPRTHLSDGYSAEKANLLNLYGKSTFTLKFPTPLPRDFQIKSVLIQFFVDDIQSLKNNLHYRIYINEQRAYFMEEIINSLDQSGPRGNLINFYVPDSMIKTFSFPELKWQIDDSTSGICDGFAIDFIKILYNPKKINSGHIKFIVRDANTREIIPQARVFIPLTNQTYTTNAEGEVIVEALPAGYMPIKATFGKHRLATVGIDVLSERLEYVTVYLQYARNANATAAEIQAEKEYCACQTVKNSSDSARRANAKQNYPLPSEQASNSTAIQEEKRYVLLRIFLFVLGAALDSNSSSSGSGGSSGSSTESSSRSSGSRGSSRRR